MNATRASVVAEVQHRTHEALGATLSMQECLAVAIAASCPRDRDAVLGFLLDTAASRNVARHLDFVALKETEWETLFGITGIYAATASLTDVCRDVSFLAQEQYLASSLRCSLAEVTCKERWKSAASRVACYVALHAERPEERISATLGGLVKSDFRRLDDVRSLLEHDGTDEMLLSKATLALAACVSGKE